MQEKYNNPIINLLVQPRFRVLRHLVLLAFTIFISAGFVWHIQEDRLPMAPVQVYGSLAFFVVLFLGGSYLNIYLIIPRLLLRNKWLLYFCCLLGIVMLIMIATIVFQQIFFNHGDSPGDTGYLAALIGVLSSTLAIFVLFAGITTFVLFRHWVQDMQQAEELGSATMQLELELLEKQINPHFLFNMLNNANFMIKTDPDIAGHIITKLEDMLRYQMVGSSREKVCLKEDILFLSDYLELEKIRRDDFTYWISEDGDTANVEVPPLLFITFVENAVKHNTDSRAASYVRIWFNVNKETLIFICENSVPRKAPAKQAGGIGLVNIKRRLELLYNTNFSLEQEKTDTKYTVKLELKL